MIGAGSAKKITWKVSRWRNSHRVLWRQLAIYLGYIRAAVLAATAVGMAFVLPSLLMVLARSAAWLRCRGLPGMEGMFYGIGGGRRSRIPEPVLIACAAVAGLPLHYR